MSAEHETQAGAPPLLPGAQERQRVLELGSSVWAFSALAGAVEAGILDELATPHTPAEISAADWSVRRTDRGGSRRARGARPGPDGRTNLRLHAGDVGL